MSVYESFRNDKVKHKSGSILLAATEERGEALTLLACSACHLMSLFQRTRISVQQRRRSHQQGGR